MAFTSTPPRTYDVFLSFRGMDTREGFTERLYQKLRWHKFVVFKDNEEPKKGMPISEKLLTAIEESKTAIIVMSPNFASSTWCLDELLKILECMEARNTVLPVFYDVDPAHVRHQLGTFAEAMVKHEQRIKVDKVQLWRDALTKLANFVGWTSKDYGSEAELIDEIVEQVQNKVHPAITLLGSTEKLVGMDSDLIQELGREIVRRECPMEPGRCSRLWFQKEIMHVLKENTGTEAIGCILLNLLHDHESTMIEDWLNPKAFSKMSNLRFLKIHNLRMSLPLISKYLPDSLSYFEWSSSCPR